MISTQGWPVPLTRPSVTLSPIVGENPGMQPSRLEPLNRRTRHAFSLAPIGRGVGVRGLGAPKRKCILAIILNSDVGERVLDFFQLKIRGYP